MVKFVTKTDVTILYLLWYRPRKTKISTEVAHVTRTPLSRSLSTVGTSVHCVVYEQ